jgi:hypothetical protein
LPIQGHNLTMKQYDARNGRSHQDPAGRRTPPMHVSRGTSSQQQPISTTPRLDSAQAGTSECSQQRHTAKPHYAATWHLGPYHQPTWTGRTTDVSTSGGSVTSFAASEQITETTSAYLLHRDLVIGKGLQNKPNVSEAEDTTHRSAKGVRVQCSKLKNDPKYISKQEGGHLETTSIA